MRFYCLYGIDAISGENRNENQLPFVATEGDWKMSLPCPEEDLAWVQEALAAKSNRVTARNLNLAVADAGDEKDQAAFRSLTVDREEFLRK